MSIINSLEKRRTYYNINDTLPVAEQEIISLVERAAELVPDAFNMKSARAVVVLGEKNKELWDRIYDAFGGQVAREKIDGFKAGAGTVLYFYDNAVVENLQAQFPPYADNFPVWANQANGMLQLAVWTGLRELGLGANLQHYNPVIDKTVAEFAGVPASYKLIAQMPFGSIVSEPDPKDAEDISLRVKVLK